MSRSWEIFLLFLQLLWNILNQENIEHWYRYYYRLGLSFEIFSFLIKSFLFVSMTMRSAIISTENLVQFPETFDAYNRLSASMIHVLLKYNNREKKREQRWSRNCSPTNWFQSVSSATCCVKQPFITLAHISPHANTLSAIPLQAGQAVILVKAAAQSADSFSYGQQRVRFRIMRAVAVAE